jgi:hypothetical protein
MRKKIRNDFFHVLLIAALFPAIPGARAQQTDSVMPGTARIEQMSDKIAVDISFNNAYSTFQVRTPVNKIILYPNTPNNLKVKVNYDFLSLGIQFSPDFLPGNGDNSIKGNTRSFQLGSAFIFRRWFADISYSKTKGFYLYNTADYMPWVNGDPYIRFPDLYQEGISVSSGYIHNPGFSLRSLTSQTERQLKSTGSFLPVFNFDYYVINDKSGGNTSQKTNNTESSIGPGYGYTFVARKKFYVSLGVFTGLGYLNTRLTTRTPGGDVVTSQDNLIFRWDGKTGAGYNGSRFYTGLYVNVSGTEYRQENTTTMNFETRVFYHVFLGMRLKSPPFIKSRLAKLKSRMP